jgi:hypothetical protein
LAFKNNLSISNIGTYRFGHLHSPYVSIFFKAFEKFVAAFLFKVFEDQSE